MGNSISKSDLARRLGVSPARVSVYVRKGMPVLKTGKLDEVAAFAWVRANVAPREPQADRQEKTQESAAAPAKPTSGGMAYLGARTAHALVKAQLARLDLARQSREFVPLREVQYEVGGMIVNSRRWLLSIPDRARERFGNEIGDFILAEVHDALSELAQYRPAETGGASS